MPDFEAMPKTALLICNVQRDQNFQNRINDS